MPFGYHMLLLGPVASGLGRRPLPCRAEWPPAEAVKIDVNSSDKPTKASKVLKGPQ